jgi:DNA-directed RNA polymerase specialized sigma24 family protein
MPAGQPSDHNRPSGWLTPEREDELVRRICAGDEAAFEEFWLAYREALSGAARAFARDDNDAKEVLDQLCCNLWTKRALAKYNRARGALYTYLRRLIWNTAAEYYRRKLRLLTVPIADDDPGGDEELSGGWILAAPTPDDPGASALVDWILRHAFQKEAGYAWQLLAFGYRHAGQNWKPQRIVGELSKERLRLLQGRLEAEFAENTGLDQVEVRDAFDGLRQQMAEPLPPAYIFPRDGETPRLIAAHGLNGRQTGETVLRDFYSGNPVHNITDWIHKVLRRLWRMAADEGYSIS